MSLITIAILLLLTELIAWGALRVLNTAAEYQSRLMYLKLEKASNGL